MRWRRNRPYNWDAQKRCEYFLSIGEGENHQAVEIVNFSEQQVVDSVERINAGQSLISAMLLRENSGCALPSKRTMLFQSPRAKAVMILG